MMMAESTSMMVEPSSSLAQLQARQRLSWAAALHPRLGSGAWAWVAALHVRVGSLPPPVSPYPDDDDNDDGGDDDRLAAPPAAMKARSSSAHGARRGGARGVAAWHVARTARTLHSLPLCVGAGACAREYRRLADVLACRMVGWHAAYSGVEGWAHFFNKTSFMHEMEEVLLPLRVLGAMARLPIPPQAGPAPPPPGATAAAAAAAEGTEPQGQGGITVVDLCGGKGFLPMCIAQGCVLAPDNASASASASAATATAAPLAVRRVLLLEKARVNWAHLQHCSPWPGAPAAEVWGPPREKLNIFDESVVERLAALPGCVRLSRGPF
jgi:hypothetical protein